MPSGLPDKPPAGWGWSYMDDTGGMYGAMCALTGLYHRNMTGRGQHIDLSQMVASVPLVGPALTRISSARRSSAATGARHWGAWPQLQTSVRRRFRGCRLRRLDVV